MAMQLIWLKIEGRLGLHTLCHLGYFTFVSNKFKFFYSNLIYSNDIISNITLSFSNAQSYSVFATKLIKKIEIMSIKLDKTF